MHSPVCEHGPDAVYCGCNFTMAIPSIYNMEDAIQIIPDNVEGMFLVHFESPIGNSGLDRACAQHFLGWAKDVKSWYTKAVVQGLDRETRFSHICNVANAKGVKFWVSRIWIGVSEEEFAEYKTHGQWARKCPECR